MNKLEYFLIAGIVGSSTLASANAFNVNENDARVSGRGGATAASNTTPSSIAYNPGGMAVEDGTNILLNGTIYLANGSYQPEGGDKVDTDAAPQVVPAFYVTSRVHDYVAVGIGMHLPFGLAISWPTNHPQSDVVTDQSLRTYYITPAIGFNLGKWFPGLSIGGGVDIVPATVELENQLQFGDATGTAHLGGDAVGIGGRFGIMYNSPKLPELKLGLMYHTDVTLDFEGKGDFDIAQPYRNQLPPDGDISTSVTMPQQIWGGVGYSATPLLDIEYNFVWTNWDKFSTLDIELPGGIHTVSPQNYKNTLSHRLGVEYKLPAQTAAVRAGFIYDPTPIPGTTLTARLPDIDRKDITIGGSKYFGNYGAHASFLWVLPGERDTAMTDPYAPQYKARYGVSAYVFSLMVSGSFGGHGRTPPGGASATVTRR
jgi:long-chain fatty acid transport protein